MTYRTIGADELDPSQGCISLDSPLAKRLLKAEVGDGIAHDIAGEQQLFEVLAIRYNG